MQAEPDRKVHIKFLDELIINNGPFHYVIDGLNVAYYGNESLSFNKVQLFVYDVQ